MAKDIRILRILSLRGPNQWTYRPVLEAWVDIGELEDFPSNTLPGFYERLSAWLPSLVEHRCSYEVRGGFLRRVQEGTWAGHILEHVTLELQNLAGMPGGFGKARETPVRGVYKVVVRAWHETVTRAALTYARDLIMAAIEDRPFDVDAALDTLHDLVDRHCLGPSTAAIVNAADDRDIPAIRLSESANLVQLGFGRRQRRIWTAETDATSAIAESISRDKSLTKSLLAACGLPVPEGRLVDSAEDAWEAAEDIGLPVVVKPDDGNHGRGVFIDLKTREQVTAAYAVAVDEGSGVIVEKSISGAEHRLLVVGDRLIAANRSDQVSVTGDGQQTVAELIESQINSDPRRGPSESHPLSNIRIDTAAQLELDRQGYSADSIPEAGLTVLVRRTANHAFDVTDDVHPETAVQAALAARIVGLDIAGIDLVAKDIRRPLAEQGGALVEVNAGPSLLMHLKPAVGVPRPVGEAIIEHLFPEPGDDGRIPVIGICGEQIAESTAHILAQLLSLAGHDVGLACATGLSLNGRWHSRDDSRHHEAGRKLLINRKVDHAIMVHTAHSIASEGLAYDRCRLGIVTEFPSLGSVLDLHIADDEGLYKVIRTQVDVVLATGTTILNADEPRVAEMASLSDGEVIFITTQADNTAVRTHLDEGGRAVIVHNQKVSLHCGNETPAIVVDAKANPSGKGRARGPDASLALAACAAAGWALGLPNDLIRACLNNVPNRPL